MEKPQANDLQHDAVSSVENSTSLPVAMQRLSSKDSVDPNAQHEPHEDGKKIATDEAGTRDTIAFWQVLPYTTYAPATILIIFGLIVTFSKQSAMCMGTTWHSSRHQVCVTCVCLLFVPLLTAYTSVYLSGELDDYYIVKAGGFQKNINPQVPLPDPKAKVGTLEFTTFTFLDIKRGASFEGKSNGKPYVGCAFPIVQGTKEKDGTLTSKQNSVTYWSSSCATTSTCCKKYYESKGSHHLQCHIRQYLLRF